MKERYVVAAVLLAVFASPGCSWESVKARLYNSMRFLSDGRNAGDPNYDPDNLPPYTEYKAQRDVYLEEQAEREKIEKN